MQRVQYVDFIPLLLEAEVPYSTLSLTGSRGGPKYESFRSAHQLVEVLELITLYIMTLLLYYRHTVSTVISTSVYFHSLLSSLIYIKIHFNIQLMSTCKC